MRPVLVRFCFVLAALALAFVAVAALRSVAGRAMARPDVSAQRSEGPMVSIRVFDESGALVGPVSAPKVVKSDAEWEAALTPDQYRITRGKGTERPFCGTLLDNKKEGVYSCVCCGLPLFTSDDKFDSGTGWPSFFQPICKENVAEQLDTSHFQMATEILCARCDAHLGHVFDDGPRPTGLRFCLNSESLTFTDRKRVKSLAEPALAAKAKAPAPGAAPAVAPGAKDRAEAVFAGGCFWCVEAVFEELDGVIEAVSGYAGGDAKRATYEAVSNGNTGHAEAVKIIYDPTKIDYETLLRVHFATHDPTTKNRQGADQGPQYRSAIFYASDAELATAKKVIEALSAAKAFKSPIVTTLEPLTGFHEAEPYHQNYVCNNPMAGYVQGVAMPKVDKVREKFADRLKEKSPLRQ